MGGGPGSSAREALERALGARPDRWEDWLVYADLLTEQGDARGELIGLSHRLETGAPSDRERLSIRRRMYVLQQEHGRAWFEGLDLPAEFSARWRHGFVVGVRLPLRADLLEALERLAAHPTGRFLAAVSLWDPGEDEGGADCATLAGLGALRGLGRLELVSVDLGAEGLAALLGAGALSGLDALSLWGARLGDEGAAALATSPGLGALGALDLTANRIGDRGVAALARSEALSGLASLTLSTNDIGDQGAIALSEATALAALTSLVANGNRIGAEGAAALVGSTALRALRELGLGDNKRIVRRAVPALQATAAQRGCALAL